MVQAGGGEQIEMDLGLVIDENKLIQQLKRVFGNMGDLYQRAGGGGGGQGNVNESGNVNQNTKEQDERSKVRTNALKHLATQFPGGGLMTSMASAFKGGGMIAGLATGMGAAVGILTGILKSSQVFQTLQNTVFKTLGMMADLFMMPFVPHMMRFVNWMLQNMPAMQEAGQKTVDILAKIWGVLTFGSGMTAEGKAEGGVSGFGKRALGFATSKEAMLLGGGALLTATGVGAGPGAAMMIAGGGIMATKLATGGYQMGGKVPGSPGEGVPTMLHGGEIVVPQDIAAGARGMGGRVAAWIERFQQKEMGPGGVISKWYDEMFGHSIIPEMWGNIRGLFEGIESEAETTSRQVAGATSDINSHPLPIYSQNFNLLQKPLLSSLISLVAPAT